jgi:hypothetical protein
MGHLFSTKARSSSFIMREKEIELPEVGECDGAREGGGLWEPPEADVEFGEGGAPKEHGG